MAKRRRKSGPAQLELPLARRAKSKPGRGGWREGAGRKVASGRRNVRHRARPPHAAAHPLHVVLRSKFRPLRTRFVFPTLRRALAAATRARPGFRVVQFSVQADHLHLIVEAESKLALSRGMQGLAIRVARAVNQLTMRHGKLWADRFFARALTSPTAVKRALAYVLNNFRHHARGAESMRIDPYSSAPYFTGFRELEGRSPTEAPRARGLLLAPRGVPPPERATDLPVVAAETWLAKVGWRRAGGITFATRTVDGRPLADCGIGT